jgi:hypothetical protein
LGTKLKILDHDRNPMPTGEVDRVFVGTDMLFEADGVQGILDAGVDDESVGCRSDGSDWKAAGAASGQGGA